MGSFFTNVAVNLVSKLGEYLFTPIGNQVGYVLCYKSYVEDLENGVQELKTAKGRVQCSVNEAQYDGKLIHIDVKNWLESVTKEVDEAQRLLERGKSAQNPCFCEWIPNPLVRHKMGKKVKETTKVIQKLFEKSRDSDIKKVYHENTPTGIINAATSATRSIDKKEDALESRASIIEDVMKAIADNNVHVIGVYGPGGVGKSKLLEDIKSRVQGEVLFDEFAMANVSRYPNIKEIQGEIADMLGLKLKNVESVSGRAKLLRQRLELDSTRNILIILDNLWKKLELKEVGIPCEDDNKVRGCKLLLTSRFRDVLRIDMGSDREFQVNELKHGEARRLFERTIGDKVNDPEFKSLVDGVVKNCGGLPLFIVPLARMLKHGDSATWRNALNMEELDIRSQVELNYKDLKDDRIRSVFLVCALDSGRTSMRDFLIYCMGLGLYKKSNRTIENARYRLIKDLNSLKDSSLLLDCDDKVYFRMHDILVDVAISIASTEWSALVGRKGDGFKKWSKDELRKCTAISFPGVGIEELPEKLDCPNLKMLLLLEHKPSLKIPPLFFEYMEKLQVLDITGLSFTSLPSSIELLENLKSLCLDQCRLEDVTIIGKLKGLQFLSFLDSTISRLPKEIGGLTELRFLDLTGCTKLKIIEPGMLGNLVNLEELYMENSFGQWEAEDEAARSNTSLVELKNMKNLSALSIAIPHSVNLPRDLPFGKLNNHKIHIGEVWDWLGEYKESRTLKLKLDSGNLLYEEWVQKCMQRTQDLHLDGLQEDYDSIHDLCGEGFQELKHLHMPRLKMEMK
ncbi:probable disease resistance protein At4g27220 [Eucalyptus grandis]|uniref:probable disease resistance protein At4g27220 n=1 Tax=Eucalyptus grandis TaxID=71139 RepID=UPI00192E9C72|nr:probable disease resistance protein At4g27220 [Eucalyptus grandis]